MKSAFNFSLQLFLLIVVIGVTSCKKLLDEKPDVSVNTISSIRDLKLLLNLSDVFNNLSTSLADVGADDYQLSASYFDQLDVNFQSGYKWDPFTDLDAWS